MIKEYFKDLTFKEDTHTYTVGSQKLPSVSGEIKKFHKEFDAKNAAKYTAKKEGISEKEVLQKWENIKNIAANNGTNVHNFAEELVKNNFIYRLPANIQEFEVVRFFMDLIAEDKYEIIDVECRMYHKQWMIAGTFDLLCKNKETGDYVIFDFKTNKDIYKNYKGQKMLGIFSNYLDHACNHYLIQQNMYQIMLEQIREIKIENRILIWLTSPYQLIELEDKTKELKEYYEIK